MCFSEFDEVFLYLHGVICEVYCAITSSNTVIKDRHFYRDFNLVC